MENDNLLHLPLLLKKNEQMRMRKIIMRINNCLAILTIQLTIQTPPTRHGKSYFVENFESDTEDPVYVVSHSTKKDKISGPVYKIVGEIKNKGDEEVTFVKIIGTFYDKDDIVIGTDYTYTDPSDIKPGRTAPFSMTIGFGDSIDVKDIAKATYSLEWE